VTSPAPVLPILAVDDVTVAFGGLVAVQDASFSVPRGAIKGVIGPNGAGKSTLFNVVSGVVTPQGGRVRLAGEDITRLPPHRRARARIARTFQTVQIFDGLTVLENVEVGCHSRTRAGLLAGTVRLPRARAEEREIRHRAGMELEFVGLDPLRLGERPAMQLPFGQQRLLEIARALAADPLVLLLDEPASGLNSVEVAELEAKLRAVRARGVTILLVEHNVDLVMRLCDSVVVLSRGLTIADGTPGDVRSDPGVQAAYLGEGASGYATA
jgi:branched-chain amino acid transport system ATP-binding protein